LHGLVGLHHVVLNQPALSGSYRNPEQPPITSGVTAP
jgi:hypothetical protein